MGEGIWHRVILDKYISQTLVVNWLISKTFKKIGLSRIWFGLMKFLFLILHGLSWLPGDGHSIHLGKDRILGLGDCSFLSRNLLVTLKDPNIFTLSQVYKLSDDHDLLSSWLNNSELNLMGDLAQEWNEYRSDLSTSGVLIHEKKDTLFCLGGDDFGFPTAKNIYSSIISVKGIMKVDFWI